MEISIRFKTIDSTQFEERSLSPEEFFDPLEEDEIESGYNVHSMYKNLYEPWLCSGKDKCELIHFSFSIKDITGFIESNYTFWNEGKCWIEDYKEFDATIESLYQSMDININEILVDKRIEKNTLLRFIPSDSTFWVPIMHNININHNGEEIDVFLKTGFEP